jgi:hypothetical protein
VQYFDLFRQVGSLGSFPLLVNDLISFARYHFSLGAARHDSQKLLLDIILAWEYVISPTKSLLFLLGFSKSLCPKGDEHCIQPSVALY